MPRLAGLAVPGALQHIAIRGIECQNILKDDKDRDSLIGRLGALLSEAQTDCYAWALMPNHAHLLLRTGKVGLVMVMRNCLPAVRSLKTAGKSAIASSFKSDMNPSSARRSLPERAGSIYSLEPTEGRDRLQFRRTRCLPLLRAQSFDGETGAGVAKRALYFKLLWPNGWEGKKRLSFLCRSRNRARSTS